MDEGAQPDRGVLVHFLVQLGGALVLAGEAVDVARSMLLRVAAQNGADDIDIIVLPTVLLIQAGREPGAKVQLGSVSAKRLRLDQVSNVYELAHRAELGEVGPVAGIVDLQTIRASKPPIGPVARTFGLGVLAAGFAVLLQPTGWGVLGAFALGIAVGLLLLVRVAELQAIMPILASFAVATAVFLVTQHYEGENPIRSLIPPLVVLLPGAAITTGTMELAGGQTISGASRLVEGIVDLLLLAFGITAAAELVDPPGSYLVDRPSGVVETWMVPGALLLIVLGNHLYQCAPRRSLPWIMLVLVVAYSGQSIGAAVFAPELSAFFGAVAMTPLVLLIGRSRTGPPSMVMFLPAFWLLVPGATGLMAVVGSGGRLSPSDFAGTMVIVMSIALGVLLGTAVVRASDEVRAKALSTASSVGWIRER